MMANLFNKLIYSAALAALILTASAANAGDLSADEYLSLKRSSGASASMLSAAKNHSAAYIGRTLDLAGVVSGVASIGGNISFIFDVNGESLIIRAKELPECIANGSAVRALVKIGPESVAGLTDLELVCALYEHSVSAREKELKELAEKKAASAKRRVDRTSSPKTLRSAGSGRGARLSSRAMQVYDPYRLAVASFNPNLSSAQVEEITKSILAYSEKYGVDPRLVIALIIAESGFRPNATSRAGAQGLCQLMPGTARGLGVKNAYDPEQNIQGSIKLIKGHLDKYGDLALALSAYNAGAGAVKKHGGVPPYKETRNYIRKVTQIYNALCGKK
jgi:hypothetical protein